MLSNEFFISQMSSDMTSRRMHNVEKKKELTSKFSYSHWYSSRGAVSLDFKQNFSSIYLTLIMTLKKRRPLSRNCEKITAAVIATTMSKSAIVKKEKK